MIEPHEWDESLDVEAMVRSAGHYVRASDDLRPRILETAYARCGEQWAQRCIRQVAVFVVLLASFTTAGRHHLLTNGGAGGGSLLSVELEGSITRAANGPSGGQTCWSAVEAFTKLRQRQAQALRLTL